MQYEEELKPYERVKEAKKAVDKKESSYYLGIIKILSIALIAFLMSRVLLINKSAPFGIAYMIVILMMGNFKVSLISSIGSILGYLTINPSVNNGLMYVFLIAVLTLESLVLGNYIKSKMKYILFSVVGISVMLAYNFLMNGYGFGVTAIICVTELASVIPLYLIIKYAFSCFKVVKTRHLFKNEELIAMALLMSFITAGFWGAGFLGVYICNVLGIISVAIIGYCTGAAIGASSGICMGIVLGMSGSNVFMYAAVLGICGLVAGIFKDGGKILTTISLVIVLLILKVYTINMNMDFVNGFKVAEGIIAMVIFFFIPEGFYNKLSMEVDTKKKEDIVNKGYINKVRELFTERLEKFSEVLDNMSSILLNLADNDKLDLKSKSSGLIDNLASRVCGNCDMKNICWNREMHHTYSAFEELIRNTQNKVSTFPMELERKCVKKAALIRNGNDIVNRYIIDEMWRGRLAEGRQLLASQFDNMSRSVEEIACEFITDITEDREAQKNIMKMFDKQGIEYDDVFCIKDKKSRLTIQVSMKSCNGCDYCNKKCAAIIRDAIGKPMILKKDGCRINPKNNNCTGCFEEVPKYKISTYAARAAKEGESAFGDSFSYGKTIDGSYMMVLSDGMGHGPQAGRESEAAVELMEKFTGAGFSKTTAINTVNSIMTLKFTEEEKFSTIDVGSIDLYTGDVEFMKVGAVASFIKSDDTIDIIKSKTLPMGVLDDADIERHKRKVKNGDIVVMVSDGIIDAGEKEYGGIQWILDYICRNDSLNPRDLADGILNAAKEVSKGQVNDDMTVLVSKIYVA